MSDLVKLVINAAGIGSRIGLNIPKSLLEVGGKNLISWQLSIIPADVNLVVVVGFKGREIANIVQKLRPKSIIMINHDYLRTNTAGSFRLASEIGGDRFVSLDGDLLTTRETLKRFLEHSDNLLGVSPVNSKTPVFTEISGNDVTGFSYKKESKFEWTGLANLSFEIASNIGNHHMYQGIEKYLPMKAQEINCMEIDELSDIPRMENWIKENM